MSVKNRFAVATIAIGQEAERLAEVSLPLIQQYADKCKASLVVFKDFDDDSLPPMYAKTRITELFEDYDVILFIDIDILVNPESPNLFTLLPDREVFAAVSVEDIFKNVGREKENLQQALGAIDWTEKYFNSGVILATKEYKSIFSSTDELIQKWHSWKQTQSKSGLNDQSVFNYRLNLNGSSLTELDRKYNFTRAAGDFNHRFSAFFIHYAGLRGNRLDLMRSDRKVIDNSIKRLFYKRFPLFVKVRDAILRRVLRLK